jgi:SP family myo-inositol transporter-like MFS transporter 13
MSAEQRAALVAASSASSVGGEGSLQTPLLALSPADRAPAAAAAAANNSYLYLLTCLSAIGGFLFGYDTGVISGAMLLLVKEFGFSSKQQELIVSVTLVGCIASACVSSVATTKLGRQPVILFASMVFMAGSAVLATAVTFEILLVGRLIVGIAVGLASMAVPMYIAEAAPPEKRGTLVTTNNVFVTGGQFVACIVDALFSKVDYPHGWRYMLGLAGAPALIMFIGFLFLPESPRWLAQHKGEARARAVLQKLRRRKDVETELQLIVSSVRADESLVEAGLWEALKEAPLRRAILLGCMLQLVQQLTGINTVMYYCGTIFVMAGYTDPTVAIWLTAGVSFIGWAACFLGVLAVERMGRRNLTLTSLAGVVLALLALGGGFKYSELTSPVVTNGTAAGRCDTYHSCFDCVSDGGCGFCLSGDSNADGRAEGYCVAGNSTGPGVGAAAAMCGGGNTSHHNGSVWQRHQQQHQQVPHSWDVAIHGAGLLRSAAANSSWYWQSCPAGSAAADSAQGPAKNVGGIVSLVATAAYLAAFQPGMGTMPWTINSEIYPLHARSLGVSLATATNWCSNLLISFTFLDLTRSVGSPEAFWIYAAVGVAGWVWFYFNLPETRGLDLEKIGELFVK